MIKAIRLMTLALGLLVAAPETASAQERESSSTPTARQERRSASSNRRQARNRRARAGAVPQALKRVRRVSGRVNQNALVYIYLQSASWCGPCRQAMPDVVEEYKKMRRDGRAEIVLIGWDQSADEVKSYIEEYRCRMPAVFREARNVDRLPGFSMASGIPTATMVDADGKVLMNGSPQSVVPAWQAQVERIEAERQAAQEAEAAEADEPSTDNE
ncbi:MAG: redoxin domain-containing protein [Akkermansia sp.]|nr:redoxin domain-containing protein [Akkermansia sp.]